MNKHFEDDQRNESVMAMIDMCSAEPDSAVMAREEAEWHMENPDYYAPGEGFNIAEEYRVAAEWLERRDAIADANRRVMFAQEPHHFDAMLDEFGCIDDMAVFAARGNTVGGMVVA